MHIHSFELRELEAKLKAAYLNKERAAQLAEKDTLKKKEEVREEREKQKSKNLDSWIPRPRNFAIYEPNNPRPWCPGLSKDAIQGLKFLKGLKFSTHGV